MLCHPERALSESNESKGKSKDLQLLLKSISPIINAK